MIRVRRLASGVRVATDKIEGVRSCALGIWVEAGSRNERASENGITHFIEHMLFKGTGRFDALELADELDRLGGNFNAHTSQETLCLHTHCVDEKAPRALELLSEMLLESRFLDEEIERERNVILEEYKMYEDSPDDVITDLYYQALWPRSALGRPILGTPETIRAVTSGRIRRYLEREFDPRRILVVLAGNFDAAACARIVRKKFGRLPRKTGARRASRSSRPRPGAKRLVVTRKVEQAHFCFGVPGPARRSRDRYAFGLMNMLLGGGMSSRLFKEVREKRGLAYSIQSFVQPLKDTGGFGIVGATSPGTLDEVLTICRRELKRICEEKVSDEEIELAREQITDSLLLSVESTSARLGRLSEAMLTRGRPISVREILTRVREVGPDQIRRVARKYLKGRTMAGAFIGPKGTSLRALGRSL